MFLFSRFLVTTVLISLCSGTLATEFQHSDLTDEFIEARKVLASMYMQQQQIEKEIDSMSSAFFNDDNQVKLFKYCKQPECHQYSEAMYFTISPDKNYTYQHTVNKDGEIQRSSQSGNLLQKKHHTLIINNPSVNTRFSYTQ